VTTFLLLVAMVATAPAAVPEQAPQSCPQPGRPAPLYPPDKLRANVSGTAVIRGSIDGCGRVIEPRILEGSGHSDLDQAALDAVRLWVLNDDERRVVGGDAVNFPVHFGGARTIVPQRVDWPRSHRRPAYLPDSQPIGFASVAEFKAAPPGRAEPVLASPYASVQGSRSGARTSTYFQQDVQDALTYWLSYSVWIPPAANAPRGTRGTGATVAVARYRLVEEDGKAVVRVALLCEESPDACDKLRGFLMKGLPIAKPPRA